MILSLILAIWRSPISYQRLQPARQAVTITVIATSHGTWPAAGRCLRPQEHFHFPPIMPVNQPSNIYREQMSSEYHGLALWDPKPVERLYKEPGHVSIGDVGYLDNGTFMRMLNVTLPWNDPLNKLLVIPDEYECIESAHFLDVRNNEFREAEYRSPHVSKVPGNLQARRHSE
jgi:hypothetical protein